MDVLSFFGLGSQPTVEFILDGQDTRKTVAIPTEKGAVQLLVYSESEPVKGKVRVQTRKEVKHLGIKVELIGEIELVYDRGNHFDFLRMEKVLAPAGTLSSETTFDFDFAQPNMSDESYNGLNARLRYYLKFSMERSMAADIVHEQDLWVINYGEPEGKNFSVRMEVGIEDCLHIEFEYERNKYHLQDVILGRIYFRLVRLRIKYMELCLVRRESTGTAPNVFHENRNVTKYEIMDGAPVKAELIPVRVYLGAFPLTPTYKNIHGKFSVKYSLNMVLVDEEDRRYFKQTDIVFWRQRPELVEEGESKWQTLEYTPNFPEKKRKKRSAKADEKEEKEEKEKDEEEENEEKQEHKGLLPK
eukprot:TRINITY_DN1422_c0_g1_i1.p1 TRINITY_DN1422_c0_g1~~TRINITY_DN1422_c0_g1_i1.p1  ORF type:complete len:371 (+),score=92.83 TRINITY_DN1422_c0_g1_i1:40-1113(+)